MSTLGQIISEATEFSQRHGRHYAVFWDERHEEWDFCSASSFELMDCQQILFCHCDEHGVLNEIALQDTILNYFFRPAYMKGDAPDSPDEITERLAVLAQSYGIDRFSQKQFQRWAKQLYEESLDSRVSD